MSSGNKFSMTMYIMYVSGVDSGSRRRCSNFDLFIIMKNHLQAALVSSNFFVPKYPSVTRPN